MIVSQIWIMTPEMLTKWPYVGSFCSIVVNNDPYVGHYCQINALNEFRSHLKMTPGARNEQKHPNSQDVLILLYLLCSNLSNIIMFFHILNRNNQKDHFVFSSSLIENTEKSFRETF